MADPKVVYIFEAIEKSGLTLVDFSEMTHTSRNSLYRWKKDGNIADTLRLQICYVTATRLEKACRLGLLPITDTLKKEQRMRMLRKIIADMSRK